MIDHLIIKVDNLETSKAFYTKVLASLGYEIGMDIAGWGCGFQSNKELDFWISQKKESDITGTIHFAFRAESRAKVDEFYKVALEAGGTDNGVPGLREAYHPNYYGAFIFDPDGNNIEAVIHTPE